MSRNVLILGNGISRLSFDENIRLYAGEIWGCNRVFLEYGDILTRIAGHRDAMEEAAQHRLKNGCRYEIYGGHLSKRCNAKSFTVAPEWITDTGTTMVAQALHEGLDVEVCGFDLGGADVLSPGIESQQKTQWVTRWRRLLAVYGSDRVTFWGHDHKPYLLSNSSAMKYANAYLRGRPHIPTDEYRELHAQRFGVRVEHNRRGGDMIKVRFNNGYETELRDLVAQRLRDKGEVVILADKKPERKTTERKTTERKHSGGVQRREEAKD